MSEIILEVNKLKKTYGTFLAVDNISFSVPKGKIIGFLGPNGAGKTTTIQMLLGITLNNGGTVKYFGRDFAKHRLYCLQRINFTSAFNALLGKISVKENLLVFAGLYQIKHPKEKIQKLLNYFEISDLAQEVYQNISAGQKTRVNLVKSLLNDPELILMDEPTASLDPDIADKTLTLIEALKKERNLAILYTSHNMNEITRICDEVIFLDHGKIVAQDTPTNLTKRISAATLKLVSEKNVRVLENYLQKNKLSFSFPNIHSVIITTEEQLIPKILFGISQTGVSITDIAIQKPTLEDVFLQIARKE
ncbi:MAG TPA: ABC transporter ATP-binding protein [Candidatus Saccharimonadales bacterium]|nr:ABC transporter ATP-binding protein [Candidatus Saccharimonadales bacterium]